MPLDVINPATGTLDQRYPLMTQHEVDQILHRMDSVSQDWMQSSFAQRAKLMQKVANAFRDDKNKYAKVISGEMGKPITQALAEIEKCALLCEYYGAHAEHFLQDQQIQTESTKSYRCFAPLGVIFAIMPWNFPFWQVMRFAVPNLMAGNACVLSHAPNSSGAALAIERIFQQCGFPQDLFRSLIIDVDLAPFVIHHPSVKGITLTGSNRAGMAVGAEAGRAMKKVVLELGGSDPYLILEDANLELAAQQCILSRLNNAGQICISAKRIIVVDAIRERFEKLIIEKAQTYIAGDPMDDKTNLGPMAREDLRQQLHSQVQQSIKEGARCMLGGQIPQGVGFYYPATVLCDVSQDNIAFKEELFGPVICITPAKDLDEAIALANDSIYGLGAAVFTADVAKGEHIAAKALNAGSCFVNKLVSSDPRLPFGGTKASGYGRELSSEGLHEFMNIKTIVVD